MEKKEPMNDPELEAYLNSIEDCNFLSKSEEKALFVKLQNGDESAHLSLVRSQLLFVVKIAKKYRPFCKPPVDFMDLIQEGNFGLLEAIRRFKLSSKNRLSTYACWYIERYIRNVLKTIPSIRFPSNIHDLSHRFKKLSDKEGRELTAEEFSIREKISLRGAERIIRFLKLEKDSVSLDVPVATERGTKSSLGDVLSAFVPEEKSPKDLTVSKETDRRLSLLFVGVKKRDVEITRMRLDPRYEKNGKMMTLDEIGRIHGITRERVRQIIEKFLKKKEKELKEFKEYLLTN